MNIYHYLKRINVTLPLEPNLSNLVHLILQHLKFIHFENLDIICHRPIRLQTEPLFQKIVVQGRGGVCFELNGLFHYLLKELGYEIKMISATVRLPSEEWEMEDTHLTNIVETDGGEYLVDIGFGGNEPRTPVPLSGKPVRDITGEYRISRDGNWLYLEKKDPTHDWHCLYRFLKEKKTLQDFIHPCHLIETSPRSLFNKSYFLSKVTSDGRISLIDRKLVCVTQSQKKKREVSEQELSVLIKKLFNIQLTDL
ncbi:arylamine N-acetyltransferase family protein [Thermoactinomyces mirandus]|uniref:Arylamine N-acetyltransferase n=1 Tax=Thermoactinomyces mirandus TaxID=2756294 RepID=A0A7W2ATK7_9BACL|nr:arylamine N-acetyltransferase [Thermoactinomyces mirandus]MBA4603621.1 arylamine N-acetyltransferase [Thermoactinomyces mirandus]